MSTFSPDPITLRHLENYYKSDEQQKVYKLTEEQGKVWLYWVTFYKMEDGSFHCGRGRDLMPSLARGKEVCQLMAQPATAEDYLSHLTRYLNAEESARGIINSLPG